MNGLMILIRDGMWFVITNMSHYKSKFRPLLVLLALSHVLPSTMG